jgi:site-specific recombinase
MNELKMKNSTVCLCHVFHAGIPVAVYSLCGQRVVFPVAWLVWHGYNLSLQHSLLQNGINHCLTCSVHCWHYSTQPLPGYSVLSGIIAGSVANRDKFRHMHYRIAEHPLLKKPLAHTC